MTRHALPILLVGLAMLMAACGKTIEVVGTYEQVWNATSGAVRDEASLRAGRSIPTPAGRGTGQARVSVIDASSGREVFFFAEIKPVGSEEVRKHEISLFVHQEAPSEDRVRTESADATNVQSERRQDIEARVASAIRANLRDRPEQ